MITKLKDCHGIMIKNGDIVRDDEGFTGKVLFIYGAWRYDVHEGKLLKFNSSLLYKEGTGTDHLEVIDPSSQACIHEETTMSAPPKDSHRSFYTERHT